MDRRTKKPTTKKKPPSKKAMQIKKDAERAKAAADPFATPGSARATLRCMITVDVDIATCFPSYEQNDGSLTKFDEGVPVHLIEAIASLNHDAKASIKVGPCRWSLCSQGLRADCKH